MKKLMILITLWSVSAQGQEISGDEMLNELDSYFYAETGYLKGTDQECSVELRSQGGEHRLRVSAENGDSRVFRFFDNSRVQRKTTGSESVQVDKYRKVGRDGTVLKIIICEDGACHAVAISKLTCILPSA